LTISNSKFEPDIRSTSTVVRLKPVWRASLLAVYRGGAGRLACCRRLHKNSNHPFGPMCHYLGAHLTISNSKFEPDMRSTSTVVLYLHQLNLAGTKESSVMYIRCLIGEKSVDCLNSKYI
jgi:hypothetical protein